MLTAILKEAWISIASYKLRTFLTMLGIIIGVSSVILIMSIGNGAKSEMENELTSVAGGQIYIYANSNRAGRTRNRRRPRGQGVAQRNGG